MSKFQLVNVESQAVVVPELMIAATFWSRFRGLQFRREFPVGNGLLLAPCRSVHSCWMRFSIDVVMLDHEGQVLQVNHHLRPWRTCVGPPRTVAVLEVPAETATLETGNRVAIRAADGERTPKAVQSLTVGNPSLIFS